MAKEKERNLTAEYVEYVACRLQMLHDTSMDSKLNSQIELEAFRDSIQVNLADIITLVNAMGIRWPLRGS